MTQMQHWRKPRKNFRLFSRCASEFLFFANNGVVVIIIIIVVTSSTCSLITLFFLPLSSSEVLKFLFGHCREKDTRERSKQTKGDISADLNRTPSWKKVFFFTSDNLQLVLPPTIFF
jgi:hypothetical protein